jgi:hypothetical protein
MDVKLLRNSLGRLALFAVAVAVAMLLSNADISDHPALSVPAATAK